MIERYRYNQDWYAIKYGLAALRANTWVRQDERLRHREHRATSSLASETEPQRHADRAAVEALRIDAFDQATTVALDCFLALEVLGRRRRFGRVRREPISARRREILKSYLRDAMLPASLVLLAGVTGPPEVAANPEYEAHAAEAHPPDTAPPEAYDNNPVLVRRAVEARTANPAELIAYVSALPRRDARVDYNLACAFAVAANEEVAGQMLYNSLIATPVARRPGLAQRAAKDPTLANVIQALGVAGDGKRVLEWVAAGGNGMAGRTTRA